ncbi:MAG: preprotein translocase subunit SecE [Kiritimatiellae bacterium]|jgi:preprotein translocase SecE subunit|nr:preprotein translocase subunit SecE [Kiritimatiellia bacterium]
MSFFKKTQEYLSGVAAEAKRVTWPGKTELWESTLVVISFIFILAATTLVCDKVIEQFIRIVHLGA